MRHSQERPFRLGMVYIVMLILYALLVISFYFLAGKELHIRDSRGDLDLPVAETAAGELAQGVVIEQVFQADTNGSKRYLSSGLHICVPMQGL